MANYTIVLEGVPPSKKNSKRHIWRGGRKFTVPSLAHEQWHDEQMILLGQQHHVRGIFLTENVKMTSTYYAKDRRPHDLSNKNESVQDLLVDAGIIKDDNWFILDEVRLIFGGIDKERPRVEIEITQP